MKNYHLKAKVVLSVMVLTLLLACSKKTAPVSVEDYDGPRVTYLDVAPMIERSCAPCHFPKQDGKKVALDTKEHLQDELVDVLERVQRDPNAMGFMPKKGKKPSLTAEEIEMLKNWARGGFIAE